MLKPFVAGSGIDEVSQRKLMDVPKPLKRRRVQDFALMSIQAHEDVYGVSDLVKMLGHNCVPDWVAVR